MADKNMMTDKNKFRRLQALVSVLVVVFTLSMVNVAIVDKERHLLEGKTLLLEMMPVDPRSIMQGDYMRIRFALEQDIRKSVNERDFADGLAVLRVDKDNIGHFEGIAALGASVAQGRIGVRFRIRNGEVTFATSSFMFQEGMGQHYQKAKFAKFKVDDQGEPLLVDLVLGPF